MDLCFFHLDDEEGNNNLMGGERGMHVKTFEANICVNHWNDMWNKSKFIQGLTTKKNPNTNRFYFFKNLMSMLGIKEN
jgi:hypothetical protein